jgi:uncharacterized protein DUF6920
VMEQGQELAARLRGFLFPAGEERARAVRAIRITERGEMRMAPEAKWIAFTADQIVEAGRSSFRWEARIGGSRFGFTTVTDAYEEGRGRLVVKLGGVIPVTKITGADADKGELQRYLASAIVCPAMMLLNASLECTAVGDNTLRLRDRQDATQAAVEYEIDECGQPICCRAERPRIEGKRAVLTPWTGAGSEFREWEGMRVASRLAVSWQLAEGEFPYYRGEVTSFAAVK